jgi:hypothetical protein
MTDIDWNAAFEEVAEENRIASEKMETEEAIAVREKRKQEEHERGVRLGWWNELGEPLTDENEHDDDLYDEEDEEQTQ